MPDHVRRHRNDFELHQIRPFDHPALQQRDVLGLHQQETAAHIRRDPAVVHEKLLRLQATTVAEAAVDLLRSQPVKSSMTMNSIFFPR